MKRTLCCIAIIFGLCVIALPAGAAPKLGLSPGTPGTIPRVLVPKTLNFYTGGAYCKATVGTPAVAYGAFGYFAIMTINDYVVCDALGIIVNDDLYAYEDLVPQGQRIQTQTCHELWFGCYAGNQVAIICKNGNPQAWYGVMLTAVTDPFVNLGYDNNYPYGYDGPGATLRCSTF